MNIGHKALVCFSVVMAIGMLFLLIKIVEITLTALKMGNLPDILMVILLFELWLFAEWYIIGSAHYEATQCPDRH